MRAIQLWGLVRKDLQIFLSDRRAVSVNFILPVVIASFFGYVLVGNLGKPEDVPVRFVDRDGSAVSRGVMDRLAGDNVFRVTAGSLEEARDALLKGKAVAAVIIPEGFAASTARAYYNGGEKPEIQIVYDPSHGPELAMVRGVVLQYVTETLSAEAVEPATGRSIPAPPFEIAAREVTRDGEAGFRDAVGQNSAGGGSGGGPGPFYNGYAHVFAGMGVQFMLFMSLETGILLLIQRRRGIWNRLRSAPLSRYMLLGGGALSGAFVSLLVLLFCFAFGWAVFDIRVEGSFAGFVGICAACSLMAASFGLLVAAFGRTPEATRPLAIFITLLLVMLGGGWLPMYFFPAWLQKATLLLPTRWAIDGLEAMTWRGHGFGAALGPVSALLVAAAIFAFIAVMRFRWEAD
ncbi:MAG TPA: hypothetical protein DCZ92_04120 [Elusimicrobia bacterium]|nr:MAG: hypothetical protein A2016_10255 [Elusimicrobia bacterium GWF2_62_30]HBA60003.1 hypothetical protein [Elusimicrobiota bacterium]